MGLAVFLVVGLIFSVWQDRDGGPFATAVFDSYQTLHPHEPSDDHVQIVTIDEASLAEFGSWPWPRHYLAVMAEVATIHGARAVGFDMIFPEPDRHGAQRLMQVYRHLPEELTAPLAKLPEPDNHFSRVLSKAPSIMARIGVDGGSGNADPTTLPLEATIAGNLDGIRSYGGAFANLPHFDSVAAGHGLINGAPDSDGIVRRVPLIAKVGGIPMPGFALELVRVSRGIDEVRRGEDGKTVEIGEYQVHTDPDADMRLHFAPFTVGRHISAGDLLAGRVDPARIKDRIIIIAAGAIGLGDVVATPLDGEVFGVDLHAQAITAIIEGSWLHRPHWGPVVEWALLIVFSLAAIWFLPSHRFKHAAPIALGLGALTCAAGWIAFTRMQLLFDPIHIVVGSYLVVLSLFAAKTVETERRERRLQMALTEARVEQARVSGELNAARDIQLGILPDAGSISGLPESIQTAALLEPAREIGGDLYDLFMLDDRRLFFLVGDVTGKGVPAALFMSISKVLTKSAVTRSHDALAHAVTQANDDIGRDNPADLFVTALAGILDCETGEVVLVNAGHDDPIVLGRGANPKTLRCDGGPPLCVMEGYPYETERFGLAPGETLVIITDGVTEARNEAGDLFGTDRLNAVLEAFSGDDPNQLIASIKYAVRGFEGDADPTDDLTVMAIGRRRET